MYEALIILSVTFLTQTLKKHIYPRWGSVGVQSSVFIVSILFALLYAWSHANPSIMAIALNAGQILLYAVGVYEVLLKRIGFETGKEVMAQQ